MFTGFMCSMAMCREINRRNGLSPMPPPVRFTRRKPSRFGEWLATNRDEPLLPGDRQDGVVAARAAGRRVDEEVDGLVRHRGGGRLRKHDIQVRGAEDLLEGVERKPAELALDEIWSVLHDGLELHVPVPALPARNEVEHVRALGGPPVLPAGVADERDGERGEERQVGGLVAHAQEPREEVDLAGDGGDGQKAGVADDEEGEYCLVGKVGVDVGRLLQDDDVAARPLRR